MAVTQSDVLVWLAALQSVFAENRQYLTDLDSPIGDGDHGINLDRGFSAVSAVLAQPQPDIAALLKVVAMALIHTVGGASGPLYGTFFLRASAACSGKTELQVDDVVAFFEAGVDGVQQRGKAAPGDKTMVDALLPAVLAMRQALLATGDLHAVLSTGVAAAEQGMLSTIPIQARKGRASYLGPRSIGHQDPGATSSYLLIKAAASVWGAGL
jgi:phosphoenolpyruvate---glycerone phosphotransferase subunit DhaL